MVSASGSYQSREGIIKVSWEFVSQSLENQIVESKEKTVKFTVETPANAEIELPDGCMHQVAAGTYQYECAFPAK